MNENNEATIDLAQQIKLKKKRKARLIGIIILVLIGILALVFNTNYGWRTCRELENKIFGKIFIQGGAYEGTSDWGMFEGQGELSYNAGLTLSGEWDNNRLQGQGTSSYEQVGTYQGSYLDSERSGKGTFKWDNGDVYVGNWEHDQMSGEGTYTWKSGAQYKGGFKNNLPDGKGELILNNKDSYNGNFAEGQYSKGTYEYKDIGTYNGEFKNCLREGNGEFIWKDGLSYKGEWKADKLSGEGVLTITDKEKLDGEFEDGVFINGEHYVENDNGVYTITYKNGEIANAEIKFSDGSTYNGKCSEHGFSDGTLTYANGDIYSGEFEDGMKSGNGTYKWVNGAKYDGYWKNDMMDGEGTYFFEENSAGFKLVGSFKDNKPEGECEYYTSSTKSYETIWSNGRCTHLTE